MTDKAYVLYEYANPGRAQRFRSQFLEDLESILCKRPYKYTSVTGHHLETLTRQGKELLGKKIQQTTRCKELGFRGSSPISILMRIEKLFPWKLTYIYTITKQNADKEAKKMGYYKYSIKTLTTEELNAAIKLLGLKEWSKPGTTEKRFYVNDDQLLKIGLQIDAWKIFINERGQLVIGGNDNDIYSVDDYLRYFLVHLKEHTEISDSVEDDEDDVFSDVSLIESNVDSTDEATMKAGPMKITRHKLSHAEELTLKVQANGDKNALKELWHLSSLLTNRYPRFGQLEVKLEYGDDSEKACIFEELNDAAKLLS